MANKFSVRLRSELDNIGMPPQYNDRIEAFSRLIKVSKFKAAALLNGVIPPDQKTLELLANEFEVNVDWLAGKVYENKVNDPVLKIADDSYLVFS